MRRVRLFSILFLLALLVPGACNNSVDPAFLASDDIRLEIKGREILSYDEQRCQLAFDASSLEFRVHTDNMSDYFFLTLSALPAAVGDRVSGSIRWATSETSGRKNHVTFDTVGIEGDILWLWDPRDGIAVSVRLL